MCGLFRNKQAQCTNKCGSKYWYKQQCQRQNSDRAHNRVEDQGRHQMIRNSVQVSNCSRGQAVKTREAVIQRRPVHRKVRSRLSQTDHGEPGKW